MSEQCYFSWTDILNDKNHPRHVCVSPAYHKGMHNCSCGAQR